MMVGDIHELLEPGGCPKIDIVLGVWVCFQQEGCSSHIYTFLALSADTQRNGTLSQT